MGYGKQIERLAEDRDVLRKEVKELQARLTVAQKRLAHASVSSSVKTAPTAPTADGAISANDPELTTDPAVQTLVELGVPIRAFRHPPAATIDAWRPFAEKYAPSARMAKNLFLKDKKKGALILCTALSDTDIDMKFLAQRLAAKNPRLARAEILMETLGLKEGAVTPLASVADQENKVHLN